MDTCSESSSRHVGASIGNTGGTPKTGSHSVRLDHLHRELGAGEGVTALVRASLINLCKGGNGIVLPCSAKDGHGACAGGVDYEVDCFTATLEFFEMLCHCSEGIMQLQHGNRHSVLRQRLEACNRHLFTPAAMAKVSAGIPTSSIKYCTRRQCGLQLM